MNKRLIIYALCGSLMGAMTTLSPRVLAATTATTATTANPANPAPHPLVGTLLQVELHKGKRVSLPVAASSVVAANPDIADVQVVSPRILYIYGKAIGETSIFAVDADGNTIYDGTISITHDISSLEREVKRSVPNADVTFKTVDGGLVMEGNAPTVAEAESIRSIAQTFLSDPAKEKIINMIKTGGSDQVMLKVKFVEMARNDLKNIGINMSAFDSHGSSAIQLIQGNDITFNGSGVIQRATSSVDSTVFGQLKKGALTLNGVIDALETQGMANVLAEPNLTTTSGQAANFLAGGQFPLPVVQSSAGSAPTVTIQYQPFGVSLKFTPVVLAHDRISLTVAPEVSTLNFDNPIQVSGITYPILEIRQASSVVELGSGDSFMLAGLLQNETTNTIQKFPGLGDLPVLGALFRSTSFQNNETDLVIIVTPYIVHPVAQAAKLQTPLDGFRPPSDLQLLMLGNLYQQQPLAGGNQQPGLLSPIVPMPTLHGAGGFIME